MESHTLDMILTVVVLSFWFLFPIGMFLSVSHVDKNTDQIIRLDHLRHDGQEPEVVATRKDTPPRKTHAPSRRRPTLIPH